MPQVINREMSNWGKFGHVLPTNKHSSKIVDIKLTPATNNKLFSMAERQALINISNSYEVMVSHDEDNFPRQQHNNHHEDEHTIDDDQESISTLLMRLVLSILIPMWTAMLLSSFFFVAVRQIIGKLGPENSAVGAGRELSVHISANNSFPAAVAVPALFG